MDDREKKNKINREWRARNKKELRKRRMENLEGRWKDLRGRAARDGRKFKLPVKIYKNMINDGCYYCGKNLLNEIGANMDRVNNNNPNYITRNVVACCKECNYVKSKVLSKEEMLIAMDTVNKLRNGDEDTKRLLNNILDKKRIQRKKHLTNKK